MNDGHRPSSRDRGCTVSICRTSPAIKVYWYICNAAEPHRHTLWDSSGLAEVLRLARETEVSVSHSCQRFGSFNGYSLVLLEKVTLPALTQTHLVSALKRSVELSFLCVDWRKKHFPVRLAVLASLQLSWLQLSTSAVITNNPEKTCTSIPLLGMEKLDGIYNRRLQNSLCTITCFALLYKQAVQSTSPLQCLSGFTIHTTSKWMLHSAF